MPGTRDVFPQSGSQRHRQKLRPDKQFQAAKQIALGTLKVDNCAKHSEGSNEAIFVTVQVVEKGDCRNLEESSL